MAARLQAAAGADRAGLADLSRLRRELVSTIQPDWHVEWNTVGGYAHGIDEVPDEVQGLIEAGFSEAALAVLRAQPTADAPRTRPAWGEPPGHSTLVEVLMWEGDIDAAWQAAQHGDCTHPHWLRLACARGEQYPADAMPILHREVLNDHLKEAVSVALPGPGDAECRRVPRGVRLYRRHHSSGCR